MGAGEVKLHTNVGLLSSRLSQLVTPQSVPAARSKQPLLVNRPFLAPMESAFLFEAIMCLSVAEVKDQLSGAVAAEWNVEIRQRSPGSN